MTSPLRQTVSVDSGLSVVCCLLAPRSPPSLAEPCYMSIYPRPLLFRFSTPPSPPPRHHTHTCELRPNKNKQQLQIHKHEIICIHSDYAFMYRLGLPNYSLGSETPNGPFCPHVNILGCHQNATITHFSFFQCLQAFFDAIQCQRECHLDRLDVVE